MELINKLFTGAFEVNGPAFTVYNQGMDKLVDEILVLLRNEPSQGVMDELNRISNILKIKQRKTALPLQSYMQVGVLDFEFAYFLDEPKVLKVFLKKHENKRIFVKLSYGLQCPDTC